MDKPKVILIHPLKTGGTSLRYMLLKEYGKDRIRPVPIGDAKETMDYPVLRGVHPFDMQAVISPKLVGDYDVVMSHYDWNITKQLPDWNIITMLRHPVQQLISLYAFLRKSPNFSYLHPLLNELGFDGWIRSHHIAPFLNNQTAYLSGHDKQDVRIAMKNLEDKRLAFGILEKFEESVNRWNKRFGWSMKPIKKNSSGGVLVHADSLALVEQLQADDMRLYRKAVELFGVKQDV